MTAHAMNQSEQISRTSRRQLHAVQLQGIDARRIISSLSGRGGRNWPTAQGGPRG